MLLEESKVKITSGVQTEGNQEKGCEVEKENGQNFHRFSRMINEYRRFKRNMVMNFNFNASAILTQFGLYILFTPILVC